MKFLRYAGTTGQPSYLDLLNDTDVVTLDANYLKPNISIKFRLDDKRLFLPFDDLTKDFLDFAADLYIADEMSPRSEAEDRWNRTFDLHFPVADKPLWLSQSTNISKTFAVLSGDQLSIHFYERHSLPQPVNHRQHIGQGYDVVCLFSGGLDSLIGAYQFLKAGKKVLLVGHQADSATASIQKTIADGLKSLFPGCVQLVQCRVARKQTSNVQLPLPRKTEDSHRPRSLLFLAIAVAVARVSNTNEVFIPENGLIALNIPLRPSRRGTLSTKTAHPAYLLQFNALCSGLGLSNTTVRNPFLYLSKTDVVKSAPAALHPLLLASNSCAHVGAVRWQGAPGVHHCGYCIPCIYRRLALYAVGIDKPAHYVSDVFKDLDKLTSHKQMDIRALTHFMKRIVGLSPPGVELAILEHGFFPPDVGATIGPHSVSTYSAWAQMVQTWATESLAATKLLSSKTTKQILGL